MMATKSSVRWTIYTIGTYDIEPDILIKALENFKIRTIIDVRVSPNNNNYPQYKLQNLKTLCLKNDIKYFWKGQQLGGMHQTNNLIEKLNNNRSDSASFFLRAIFNSIEHPSVILCQEIKMQNCIRKYISDALIAYNLAVIKHIWIDKKNKNKIVCDDYKIDKNTKINIASNYTKDDSDEKKQNNYMKFEAKMAKKMSRKDAEFSDIDVFSTERKKEFFVEWRIKDKSVENKMNELQQELLRFDSSLQILQSCAANNMHITMNQLKINNKSELDLAIKVIKEFEGKNYGISDIVNLCGFNDFNKKVLFINAVPSKNKNLFIDIYDDLKNRFTSTGLTHKKGSFDTHITVCKASTGKNSVISSEILKFIKQYEKNNCVLGKVGLSELVFCVKRKKNELTPPILYSIKLC